MDAEKIFDEIQYAIPISDKTASRVNMEGSVFKMWQNE